MEGVGGTSGGELLGVLWTGVEEIDNPEGVLRLARLLLRSFYLSPPLVLLVLLAVLGVLLAVLVLLVVLGVLLVVLVLLVLLVLLVVLVVLVVLVLLLVLLFEKALGQRSRGEGE